MRHLTACLVVLAFTGCKKKETSSATSGSAAMVAPASGGSSMTGSSASTDTGSAAGSAAAAPAPATPPAGAVDVCAMIDKATVEKVMGTTIEKDPESQPAQGSLLGMCMWIGKGGEGIAMLEARPAGEYEGTIGKDAKPLTGLGEKAASTAVGVMWKPAGKPYFLHASVTVMKGRGTSVDDAKSQELAKAVK